MVNKDERKFLDEIYFIGEREEFKKSFLATPKRIENKRKAYDRMFCTLCETYGIANIDNIYILFDKLWDIQQPKGHTQLMKNTVQLMKDYKNYKERIAVIKDHKRNIEEIKDTVTIDTVTINGKLENIEQLARSIIAGSTKSYINEYIKNTPFYSPWKAYIKATRKFAEKLAHETE